MFQRDGAEKLHSSARIFTDTSEVSRFFTSCVQFNVYHSFYPASQWLSVCLCVSGAEEVVSCFTYPPTKQPGWETQSKDAPSLSLSFLDENRGEWRITERDRGRGEDQSKKYDPLSPWKRTDPLPVCVCVCVCVWTEQNSKRGEAGQRVCVLGSG